MASAVLKRARAALIAWCAVWPSVLPAADASMAFVDAQIAAHAGKSGAYVLDTSDEALLARAWLVDHARESVEVQYFIWSTDNIGILAAEALLRAAERGVRVRVIVDDLLIDAPDKSLLALARHSNIDIRIYNPKSTVGVPLYRRLLNMLTDFRAVNQRMHDKTLVVDGKVAITGGRNMAAEYFDYNHTYNFRDRDVLLLGKVVQAMQANFEAFWQNKLSVAVEDLYEGKGWLDKTVRVDEREIKEAYLGLAAYAKSPDNYAPEVRLAVADTPASFARLARQMAWGEVEFIHDRPGKNEGGFDGGGQTASALAALVRNAKSRVVIQSPYLVLSDKAMGLFREATGRGVKLRINTNSLASTDNLPAFSGYRNQREKLLAMGIQVYEYRPAPDAQRKLMLKRTVVAGGTPIASLHAKTMVIDSKIVFIGTFNLDPRSENLNTEVGVVIGDEALARAVEAAIEADMAPGSSWNASRDDPDQHVPLSKRLKVLLLQLLPIRAIL